MKISVFLFMLLSAKLCLGQSSVECDFKIDSLNKLISDINFKTKSLEKEKLSLKERIAKWNTIKNKIEIERDLVSGFPVVINYLPGRMYDKPTTVGYEILKIPTGDTVLVFELTERPFFKVMYKNKVGYVSYASFEENEKIKKMLNRDIALISPRLVGLINAYGSSNASKIIKGEIWIGMTDGMARASVGSPDDINRSKGSWGVHEQWVYEDRDMYLYFENGKLTSIQD